jgi:hypothetical protein
MKSLLRLILLALFAVGFVGASGVEMASAQEKAAPETAPTEIKVVQTPSDGAYAAWGGLYVSDWCFPAENGCWITFSGENFKMQWRDGEAVGKVGKGNVIEAEWKGVSGNSGRISLFFLAAKGQLQGSWGYGGSTNSGGDLTFGRPKK